MTDQLRPSNHRVESFSDGVFAFAMTIMVLEIQIPDQLASVTDIAAVRSVAVLLTIYALSFVVGGILWGSHHYLLFTLPKVDRATLWLNNNTLFWVTLIPIVARFFGPHPTSARAAAAYGFVLMMCVLSLALLRSHAVHVTDSALHRAIHRRVFPKAALAVTLFAVSMPLAFVDVRLAWVCFLVVPAMFFLPVVGDGMTAAKRAGSKG